MIKYHNCNILYCTTKMSAGSPKYCPEHNAYNKISNKIKLSLLKFRAKFIWIWRIGLIKRTTAFRWEMDVAVFPKK